MGVENKMFSLNYSVKKQFMKSKEDEKSIVEHLLQDMHVRLRDMDDFKDHWYYKKIISKFQKGFEEEYSHS